jgi:hypothetical protein
MVHDETTYMDDEGLPYTKLSDDGEDESAAPMDGASGGRMWGYGEEAWGGWSAAE